MKNIFKIIVKTPDYEQEMFFDDQNRAERFINAMQHIMTDKGKEEVEFIKWVIECIDSDGDIMSAYSSVMDPFGKEQ